MENTDLNTEYKLFAFMSKARKGKMFFIEQFQKLAENTAIRKALQRLTESGKIVRVAQGIYVIPRVSELVGTLIPRAEEVIKVIAKKDRARIIPTGVTALNLLGLSTQVPMKLVYLTDGAPRTIKIGKQTVKLIKASPKNLSCKGEISSLIIQALKTIGKDKLTTVEIEKIFAHLQNEKQSNIAHDMKLAPYWIHQILKQALSSTNE